MNNLPITVIITTYNDSEYLCGAIDSIINQSKPPKQLIVVDDGSIKNDAQSIVERYICNGKNIDVKFFRKDNGGVSSARNYGIRFITQSFTVFLDADDRMTPNNLELKYNSFKNLSDDYFGIYGSAITSDGRSYSFCNVDGVVSTSLVGFYNHGIPGGCQYYLFRTKSIVDVGGFDETLSNNEDFDFIIRMLRAGQSCKGMIGCSVFITIRENSLSRNSDYDKIFHNLMKFLAKAEKNNFFEEKQLNKRKTIAYLFLAKRTIKRNPIRSINLVVKAVSHTTNPFDLYQLYKGR